MGVFKNITTGKDNKTHDIVRVAMALVIIAMVLVYVIGNITYLYGYFYLLAHPGVALLPLQELFTANTTFAVGFAAFLMGGASSLFFKKSTEPDGVVNEIESINLGQAPTTNVNTTVVQPGATNIQQ